MKNNNKSEVIKFCEAHSITEDEFYGREVIVGNLDLGYVTKLPKGFNPTVDGSLWLRSVETLPAGFNPTVGGYLDLRYVKELPAGFNPIVGDGLNLSSVTELPDSFNPTVGGSLWLNSVKSIPDSFNPTVGGSLWLNSVKSIPDSFNPTVGGYLNLSSVTELPADLHPTVGWSIILNSVTELPDDFNPTVGGYLCTKDTTKFIGNLPNNSMLSWQNGKYIKVDGIFTEVIKHKGNIYHTKLIGKDEITYLVTDGNGTWAHGSTLSEAKEDLIYKNISRNKDDYSSLTLDSKLTFQEAVTCYRVITGACAAGVREFVARRLTRDKNSNKIFTVKEIIDITVGEYGHDAFVVFFSKK